MKQVKRIIKLRIIIALVLGSLYGKAQQIPFYTHYYINPFIYNPAYTGAGDTWNTYLIHHSQWNNFPGAPVTSALTIDGPIKAKKIGIGLNLIGDVTGITSRLTANTSYSYRIDLNDQNKLAFGLSLGIITNQIDFSKQKVLDPAEASIVGNFENRTIFDANFGVSYSWKKLDLGFCVPQLLNNSVSYLSIGDARSYYNFARHYLTSAKYTIDLDKQKGITVYPLVLVRTMPGVPIQYDINAVLNWQKYGWFGVSYKNEYAITLNLGIRYNGLSFGYSYDMITSAINAYSGSSSEFILGYSFGPKPEKRYDDKIDLLARKVSQLESQNKHLQDSLKNINKDFDKNIDPEIGGLYRLNNVNFSTKSYELNKKSKEILEDLVYFLEENPTIKIEIQGHTDDVGTPENNEVLSENRAKSVYDYLTSRGIDEERLRYKAFGESRPVVVGTTSKIRALNRRTEILIIEK